MSRPFGMGARQRKREREGVDKRERVGQCERED